MKKQITEQLFYRQITVKEVPMIDYLKIDWEHKTIVVSRQEYFSLLFNEKAHRISNRKYDKLKKKFLKKGYEIEGPINFDYYIREEIVRKALRMEDPKEKMILLSRRPLEQADYYDFKLLNHTLDMLYEGNISIIYFNFWAKLYSVALNYSPVTSKKQRKLYSLMINTLGNLIIAIQEAGDREEIKRLILAAKQDLKTIDQNIQKKKKAR